jgi:hypothetical protein
VTLGLAAGVVVGVVSPLADSQSGSWPADAAQLLATLIRAWRWCSSSGSLRASGHRSGAVVVSLMTGSLLAISAAARHHAFTDTQAGVVNGAIVKLAYLLLIRATAAPRSGT